MKICNNRYLNTFILLGLLLPLTALLYLAPVDALPVCGTITKSTYNFAGCTGGTLTIGASNINFGCKSGAVITATGAYGILINLQSNVTVFGCKVTGATQAGFEIIGGNDNSLTDNTATNDYAGFEVGSTGNTLAGNIATGNKGYGGFALLAGMNNTLVKNTATSNVWGFIIDNSASDVLSGNTATSNTYYGIWAINQYSRPYSTITDNTANTNNVGFYFDNSTSGNIVVGNAATGNTVFNADSVGPNNFHTSLNPGIKTPYTGLQSP